MDRGLAPEAGELGRAPAADEAPVRPAHITLRQSLKISVTTFHYDLARTGWNSHERVLKPRNVEKERFGRWWHTPLDGEVYAAPLVVAGAKIGKKPQDVVIASTVNDSVYALNADTGAILWRQHLATALTDDEYNDCINITPLHGISSTPVIDLARKRSPSAALPAPVSFSFT